MIDCSEGDAWGILLAVRHVVVAYQAIGTSPSPLTNASDGR